MGPPIAICGNPALTVSDSNDNTIAFLAATFNAATSTITISLPTSSDAVKGNYTLSAVFASPGAFSFALGLSLSIYDICDNSFFASAPILSPNNQIYFTGQGDLAVSATYPKDQITLTTSNICGVYSIVAEFNSVSSSLVGGTIDPALTYIIGTDPNNLKFYSN